MKALYCILTAFCCLCCFLSGYDYASDRQYTQLVHDTITIVDTITLIPDTIVTEKYLGSKIVNVSVHDTVHTHNVDTIQVSLDVTQREYKDSTYIAWVSGYEPQLDSIRIFQKTRIVEMTKKAPRIGVGVGMGLSATRKGILPGVFVGVGYRLF